MTLLLYFPHGDIAPMGYKRDRRVHKVVNGQWSELKSMHTIRLDPSMSNLMVR